MVHYDKMTEDFGMADDGRYLIFSNCYCPVDP